MEVLVEPPRSYRLNVPLSVALSSAEGSCPRSRRRLLAARGKTPPQPHAGHPLRATRGRYGRYGRGGIDIGGVVRRVPRGEPTVGRPSRLTSRPLPRRARGLAPR